MTWRRCGVLALIACLAAALLVASAAPTSDAGLDSTAKKRCHYVIKKVRGKKELVRVSFPAATSASSSGGQC